MTKTQRMVDAYNNNSNSHDNTLINAMSWPVSTKPCLDYFGDDFYKCKISVCDNNKDAFLVELNGYNTWIVYWVEHYGRYFATPKDKVPQVRED